MKVVVTGGAGFIGSHVCEALLSKGYSVVCIDNFNDYYSPKRKEDNIKACLKNKNFILCRADITDAEELRRIFKENKVSSSGRIVHLAARAGVRASIENPLLYSQTNINGTLNLLEVAKELKIKNFVFASSSSVYGTNRKVPFSEDDATDNIISPYAATKRAAEYLCRCYHSLYGMNITCLRFFTVYGPRGRPDMAIYKFASSISEGKPVQRYGKGDSKRDYTYVGDIVNGVIAAVDKELGFEIINLGNSHAVELNYLIALIEKHLGKKAKVESREVQKGDVPETYADISKAKRLLGYNPKVSIEEGIGLFIEWFKNRN